MNDPFQQIQYFSDYSTSIRTVSVLFRERYLQSLNSDDERLKQLGEIYHELCWLDMFCLSFVLFLQFDRDWPDRLSETLLNEAAGLYNSAKVRNLRKIVSCLTPESATTNHLLELRENNAKMKEWADRAIVDLHSAQDEALALGKRPTT